MPQVERVGDETDPDRQRRGQQPAGPGALRAMDQQPRTQHRGQRGEAGEDRGFGIERDRASNQRHPQRGQPFTQPARTQLRNRAQRQQRAGHQFPRARRQHVEGKAVGRGLLGQRPAERARRDQPDQQQPSRLAMAGQRAQQQRKDDVELLLDRQRPALQQRHRFRAAREIAGLGEEPQVAGKQQHGQRRFRHGRKIARQIEPAGQQRGQYAPGAAFVKAQQREAALFQFARQNAGDQEARDHEKHVDPDETPAEPCDMGVEQHHRHDGQCAQPVDVGAVQGGGRRGAGRGRGDRVGLAIKQGKGRRHSSQVPDTA